MAVIDARPVSRDKTAADRQRFIHRAKNQIKEAVKKAIEGGSIKNLENGRIQVPIKGLTEPTFKRDGNTGIKDKIYTGNDKFIKGDSLPREKGSGSKDDGEGSPDGEGEDGFVFNLTKDEFLEFFFQDLDLPDMVKNSIKTITRVTRERAGYVTTGSPTQLDIKQTYKFAFARHQALGRPSDEYIAEQEELELPRISIADLKEVQSKIPFIDDIDLRYRNYPPRPKPTTQAVMFLVMDVSGSMDEQRKDIAKRFFLLLDIMLTKKYTKVELVFIRHHSEPEEVDEHDFFYKTATGGTIVSTALQMVSSIIDARYPNDWNVYVSHASDGDNYYDDNPKVVDVLMTLMPKVQYFAYLQVAGSRAIGQGLSNLYGTYEKVGATFKNLQLKVATSATEVWPVFKELFKKE